MNIELSSESNIGKVSFPRMSELAGVQQLCCAVQCSGGGQGGRRQEGLLHINTARTLLLAPAAAGTGRGDHEEDADTGGEAGGGHPGLPGHHGQRRGQHHRGRK